MAQNPEHKAVTTSHSEAALKMQPVCYTSKKGAETEERHKVFGIDKSQMAFKL